MKRAALWIGVAVVAVGVLGVARWKSAQSGGLDQSSLLKVSQPAPGQGRTVKGGYVAARSEQQLDQAIDHVAQKDREAFDRMLATGDIVLLQAGTKVEIESCLNALCSKVKIRQAADKQSFYTLSEALN